MKQFSKRLLALDYIITIVLLVLFLVCTITNGIYTVNITQDIINSGLDLSAITVPIDLGTIEIIITAWIAQLGITSAAYFVLIKSEHKIELPIRLLNELPEDIKSQCDMTSIITAVLTSTDN